MMIALPKEYEIKYIEEEFFKDEAYSDVFLKKTYYLKNGVIASFIIDNDGQIKDVRFKSQF